MNMHCTTQVLAEGDVDALREMLSLFADAFEDPDTYLSRQPTDAWLGGLLASDTFVAVAAYMDGQLVGGLAAYLLRKFEQARSECYIYDLAVAEPFRRRGVASMMIRTLHEEAARRGAYVVFVQADYGDEPAVALYTKLGVREDVMHFDLDPRRWQDGND